MNSTGNPPNEGKLLGFCKLSALLVLEVYNTQNRNFVAGVNLLPQSL